MISDTLVQMLNSQINAELQSSYHYMAMSTYARQRNMDGFGTWLQEQAKEELGHALKIYQYLVDLGASIELGDVKAPKSNYHSMQEVFEDALSTERRLGETLNDIAQKAVDTKDNTTFTFLQWFLTEQVEEVASVSSIVEKLKLVGEDGNGLLNLDMFYGQRGLAREG
ncbi:MAG: ferritin [Bdellovibrionales bacterium]|nr:ferritin [Bdellovibrionales bacterium]